MKNTTEIYRLKYTDEAQAVKDLKAKGVINSDKSFTDKTEAVVWDIRIPETKATYDENGDVLTEATFASGYHVDILVYEVMDFGTKETNPVTPHHGFSQSLS